MTTIVRQATEKDMPMILEAAQEFAKLADIDKWISPDPSEFEASIRQVFAVPFVEVYVAEHDGRFVGSLGAIYAPYLWNQDRLTMDELFFWVADGAPNRTALRLLRHTLKRAKEKGVSLISFKTLRNSPDGVERVYETMGLRKIETTYAGLL